MKPDSDTASGADIAVAPLPVHEMAVAIAARVAPLTGAPLEELVTTWRREISNAILAGELHALMPATLTQLDPAALYAVVASQVALVAPAAANEWLRARGVPARVEPPALSTAPPISHPAAPRAEPTAEPPAEDWPATGDIVDALSECLREGFVPAQLRRMLNDAAKRRNLDACRTLIHGAYRWHPVLLVAWLDGRAFLRSVGAARRALADAFPQFGQALANLDVGSIDHRSKTEIIGPDWCPVPAQCLLDCG